STHRYDGAPARTEFPARFELSGRHLIALIAHRLHAAQLDGRTQEERRVVRRLLVIGAQTQGHSLRERIPAHHDLLEAFEVRARTEILARHQVHGLGENAARRREHVVATVELEDGSRGGIISSEWSVA